MKECLVNLKDFHLVISLYVEPKRFGLCSTGLVKHGFCYCLEKKAVPRFRCI